ncbi:MAG: acyl-CoA dehydrogenase C-terminal domain-containing protein, partial [Caulobacteraceae bacterium]|nr:acyl-CoA dehydrogenase C-terminal domain-containing protein [Caulobacteraceae bacterium]
LAEAGRRLAEGVQALEAATDWMLSHRGADSLAGATPYLKLAGHVIGGWVLARQAMLAAGADDARLKAKAGLLRIYAAQVLTGAGGLAAAVTQGAAEYEALGAEAFAV